MHHAFHHHCTEGNFSKFIQMCHFSQSTSLNFSKMASFPVTICFLLLGMMLWVLIQTIINVCPALKDLIPSKVVMKDFRVQTPDSASVMSVIRPKTFGCPIFNQFDPPRWRIPFYRTLPCKLQAGPTVPNVYYPSLRHISHFTVLPSRTPGSISLSALPITSRPIPPTTLYSFIRHYPQHPSQLHYGWPPDQHTINPITRISDSPSRTRTLG